MRRDIVIEVVTSDTFGKTWEHVDTYQEQQMTIQHISNLLTGVDNITASSTLSVKLPRTVRNDRIFDLATRPQHQSSMTHRKIECRVTVNGINMMKSAFCYLLDSEFDNYEVVIVFGLMQHYGQWLDEDKTLKDLEDAGQSVLWNWRAAFHDITVPAGSPHDPYDYPPIWYGNDANINTYTPRNGLGKLMYYGIYTPGFRRTDNYINYANVHPFVTMREIWQRIISENSLSFILPTSVLRDMEDLAIVLTSVSGNAAQGTPNVDDNFATGHPDTIRLSSSLKFGWNIICTTLGDCYQNGNQNEKGKILFKGDSDAVDLQIQISVDDTSSFPYEGSNRSASYILNEVGHLDYLNLCVYVYSSRQTITLTPTYTHPYVNWQGTIHVPCPNSQPGDAIADIWIDNDARICNYCDGAFDDYWMGGRSKWDALFIWFPCSVVVRYYTDSIIYPHPNFRCFPNLPDIKQLDFVKFVCQLYCLFPVVDPSSEETIRFVPFDTIQDNIYTAYDWSHKLIEYARDVPKTTSFKAGDYARNNIIAYKEDRNDPVSDYIRRGVLFVDDHTLDKEKDLVTFPLAATEDNTINQYKIRTEVDDSDPPVVTYEAEFTECVHRLMRVTEWYDGGKNVNRLGFVNLSVPYIISTYYATYQAAIMQPRVITEHIRLNELEIRDVDFTRPVYLGKYGRYFAIKQIQWTVGDEYAEVELLLLGESS